MVTLNLGVVDVAYSDGDGATTTGDVAGYLEAEYHVMRTFLELHEGEIGDFLADAMAGEIESLAQGKPLVAFGGKDVTTHLGDRVLEGQSVNGRIEEAFRDFLDDGEWQRVSGQTIDAAEQGVSQRKKQPNKKRSARSAFVDTGLYQASFRAWLSNS
ncbi:MAG TPA: hypothetical protein VF534_27345 [Paraburkholderia sp.]